MLKLHKGLSKENSEILFSDKSIQKLCNDNYTPSYISHPLISYYSAFMGDVFVGAFMVTETTIHDRDVHLLLTDKALYYTRIFCEMLKSELFKDADRITARVFKRLWKMQNMLKKIGFTKEGEIRNAYKLNGRFDDIVIYGLLKTEWEKDNGRSN